MYLQVLSFLILLVASFAKPLAVTRDSIHPPITSPNAQTTWRAGETQTVVWDLSGLEGVQPTSPTASIILGTFTDNQEHLMFDTPLISGFPILGGNISLVVPSVPTGSDYIVCLFGSSGDISAPFTIIGNDAPAPSTSDTTTPHTPLPPHQTTDNSTSTVSLPPSATRTDPGTTSPSPPPSPSPPSSSGSGPTQPESPSPVSSPSPSPSPASTPPGSSPSPSSVTAISASDSAPSAPNSAASSASDDSGAAALAVDHLHLLAVLSALAISWAVSL